MGYDNYKLIINKSQQFCDRKLLNSVLFYLLHKSLCCFLCKNTMPSAFRTQVGDRRVESGERRVESGEWRVESEV